MSDRRYTLRLSLLALAILAGMALHKTGSGEHFACLWCLTDAVAG